MKAILSFLVAIQLLIFSPIQAQQMRQAGELNDKQCELLLPERIGSGQAVSIGFLAKTTLLQAGEGVNLVIRNANDEVVVNKAITMQPETVPSLLSGLSKGVAIQTEGNYSVSIIGSQGQVLDVKDLLVKNGRATKKPLFEVFTSSTCGPCYGANQVFNQTMIANPGTHSLIKYQMNWPGAGDPYYTVEGGTRRTYYGVNAVPDLYVNGTTNTTPYAISQAVYESFLGLPTDLDILITEAIINDDNNVTVSVSLQAENAIEAGAKLHLAVVEKITTGNVASNGETEFHNVMLKMLPNANGTSLPALNPGTPYTLTESYDMDLTFMEEAHDLAVIAFVQTANKEVLQSEMVDVGGSAVDKFDVTFNVKDSDGTAVEAALVTIPGVGAKTTGTDGTALFPNIIAGTYDYTVTASGLFPVESSFTVVDSDLTVNIILEIPSFYFYEDFTDAPQYGIPDDWFGIVNSPDMLYTYNGVVNLFKQTAGNDPILLISPLIDLAPAGELMFDVGAASFNPGLKFGTMTDPNDASTFVELYSYTPETAMETITIDVADINGGQGEVHLVWGHGAVNSMSYFSMDDVRLTWKDAPATYNVTFNVTNSSGTAIPGAMVSLEGFDNQSTNSSGNTVFTEVDPGTYSYTVFASGYSSVTGEVTVIDENITESVVLPSTSYYFYEDFDAGIPSDWTVHVTSPDFLMPSDGTVLFFRQASSADNPILLISPMIDITPAGELMFDYGERFDNPVLAFGTVTNPNDPSTFEIIETYDPSSAWNTATIDVSEINGGQGDTYLAWALTNAGFSYFYFDEVILTFGDASPSFFFDDFDSYTAGEQLACQNPEAWTTWSNAPCSDEDAWVSDDVSFSGSNSVKVINDVDLVKVLDNHTEGVFDISFKLYIPSGNYAYFNSLQSFNGSNSEWGFEGYFPPGGTANISAGGANAATYSFSYDTWLDIRLQVDLNSNWAEYYYNNNLIHGWQWSLGATGSGNLNQLGGIDFYGWTESGGTALFYFDDFRIDLATPLTPPSNFTAEVINDSDVLLSWDAPAGPVIAYNVYRDNVIIAQEITETTYTDVGLFPGSYMFDVKAIYDEGLSGGAGPLEVIIPGGTDRNFVVLEIATGTWCVYCPGAAMGADDLVENGHDVVVIEYHSGDIYENNDSKARINYYDVSGYPTSVFDGTSKKSGGNANTSIYPTYLEFYNTHIEKVAYFEIDAFVESVNTSATTWKLKVDAEMVYEFDSDDLVLHAALTESHIPQTWFNQTEVNFVCRTMIPNSDGTALDFSSSNMQTVEIEFEIPTEYVMTNLEVVVFIQDKVSGAIHQAQKADFIVGIDEEMQESTWIYPNPANDKIQINTNGKKSEITIYDIHGRLLDSFMLDGIEKTLDISTYKSGLYLFKLSNTEGTKTEKILVK